MDGNALQFARTAKALGRAAHDLGLTSPSFRSPPRRGVDRRTIRRDAGGESTVAVRIRRRPWVAVVADMVEGVVVANELTGEDAARARDALWAAVADQTTPSDQTTHQRARPERGVAAAVSAVDLRLASMAAAAEPGFRDAPLNPAQQAVIELLGAKRSDHPAFDPGLGTRLQVELEAALWPLAEQFGDDVLWVTKHELSGVHGCEARHLADDDFAWSVPLARGTIVHKAVELSVHWPADPLPGDLVDEAMARLTEGSDGLAQFLQGCRDVEVAELRAIATDQVTKFLECFPPLQRAWVPVTESRVRVELCDGRVVLGGKIDLSLGKARGQQAGKVLIDLKTGAATTTHLDDLRYYALVETMRLGTPPRLLASYYLDQARAQPEIVTEHLLEAALARTVDGARRLVELRRGGAEPLRRPGPACRWCPLQPECPEGLAFEAERADR